MCGLSNRFLITVEKHKEKLSYREKLNEWKYVVGVQQRIFLVKYPRKKKWVMKEGHDEEIAFAKDN